MTYSQQEHLLHSSDKTANPASAALSSPSLPAGIGSMEHLSLSAPGLESCSPLSSSIWARGKLIPAGLGLRPSAHHHHHHSWARTSCPVEPAGPLWPKLLQPLNAPRSWTQSQHFIGISSAPSSRLPGSSNGAQLAPRAFGQDLLADLAINCQISWILLEAATASHSHPFPRAAPGHPDVPQRPQAIPEETPTGSWIRARKMWQWVLCPWPPWLSMVSGQGRGKRAAPLTVLKPSSTWALALHFYW